MFGKKKYTIDTIEINETYPLSEKQLLEEKVLELNEKSQFANAKSIYDIYDCVNSESYLYHVSDYWYSCAISVDDHAVSAIIKSIIKYGRKFKLNDDWNTNTFAVDNIDGYWISWIASNGATAYSRISDCKFT